MSSDDRVKLPLDLITNIDRNDLDYDGGISARRRPVSGDNDDSEEVEVEVQQNNNASSSSSSSSSSTSSSSSAAPTTVAQPQKSFFEKLCCCFFPTATIPPPSTTTEQDTQYLLPPLKDNQSGVHCLVLDLDETLVHSSFTPIPNADFIIPIEIEGQLHQVYVLKRPGVDEFMKEMGKSWEIVVFTASLAKYADPVLDLLDIHKVVEWRLFREHCVQHKGNYVKDLAMLGRKLQHTIIVDNSPASYLFHPEYAVPITSWFEDEDDTELTDLTPFLHECAKVDDVTVPLAEKFGSVFAGS